MEWEWYDADFAAPTLINTRRAKWPTQLMRRKLRDGSRQYRAMTGEGLAEAQNIRAW